MFAIELRLGAALLLALLVTSTAALAEGADTMAEALFRAGRDASRRGDVATACERYRESYRLVPTPGTLLNIAVCEADLGQLADAWRHYQEVINSLSRDDQRVALATEKLRALEARLPRLTIACAPDAPADLSVRLDGIELGAASLGVALPVNPGTHVIEAHAARREVRRHSAVVKEGDRITIEVEPGAALLPAPHPALEPKPPAKAPASTGPRLVSAAESSRTQEASPDERTLVAYGLLGAGAASLVAGVAAGALVLDRLDTVNEHCPERRCDAEGLSARDSGQTFYVAMLTAFGLAAAASGTSIYLLLSAPDPAEKHPPRFAPVLGSDRIGAAVRASF
jgi:tetratricopeptide (TPR) repeat protein